MAEQKRRGPGRPPQPEALYRQVLEDLSRKIRTGEWPPGTVIPSYRSLAATYGVGENTVRMALRALRAEASLQVNLRRRLVVLPQQAAVTVTERLILEILTVFLDDLNNSADFREMQQGVENVLGSWPASLLIAGNPRFRFAVPQDALNLTPRAVLLHGALREETLDAYEKLNVPVVLMDQPPGKRKLHACAVDNEWAARDAVERLLALGHRRIAFFQFVLDGLRRRDPDSLERRKGYMRAMKKAGLYDRNLVFSTTDRSLEFQADRLHALLKRNPPVTAALAVDPGRARMAIKMARSAGLRVPEDFSVVSFTGASRSKKGLTGPATDFRELGRRAAELLKLPIAPVRQERIRPIWQEGETLTPRGI